MRATRVLLRALARLADHGRSSANRRHRRGGESWARDTLGVGAVWRSGAGSGEQDEQEQVAHGGGRYRVGLPSACEPQ